MNYGCILIELWLQLLCFYLLFRLQDAVDAGLEYSNSLLAFNLLRSSNLSAHVQSRVLSAIQLEYDEDCDIIHLVIQLLDKEFVQDSLTVLDQVYLIIIHTFIVLDRVYLSFNL